MVNIFSEKEMNLITDTLDSSDNYKRILKHRIINKLQTLKLAFKNLVASKINNMKVREILDSIGLILYPNMVKSIITSKLPTKKLQKSDVDELETFLINQRVVINEFLNSKNLNSKMKKILRNIGRDIKKKGFH